MNYCRNFGREAPELDWEELERKRERDYLEQVGTHTVTASVTIYKTFENCSPAEAVEFMNDTISDRLQDFDDFEADIKEVS